MRRIHVCSGSTPRLLIQFSMWPLEAHVLRSQIHNFTSWRRAWRPAGNHSCGFWRPPGKLPRHQCRLLSIQCPNCSHLVSNWPASKCSCSSPLSTPLHNPQQAPTASPTCLLTSNMWSCIFIAELLCQVFNFAFSKQFPNSCHLVAIGLQNAHHPLCLLRVYSTI